jgi:hypothetical protein
VGDPQQEVFLGREWGHTGGNVSSDMARLVDDEIKALAEDDFDKLNAAAEALSIEDVKKRHA